MITRKICMIGATAVGKTALVEQFVHSVFSDRYLSTLGVKISKKNLTVDGQDHMLMLWDLEGKGESNEVHIAYLRGAAGFFTVCDGTRRETLGTALALRERALEITGPVFHMLLVNKEDLAGDWQITDADLAPLREAGLPVLKTSAKTGLNTLAAFTSLVRGMDGP